MEPAIFGKAVYTARVMLGIEPKEINTHKLQQEPQNSISEGEFTLYPNPADNSIIVAYTGDLENLTECIIEIFDIFEKKVKSVPLTQVNQSINITNLSQGVFLLRIDQSNKPFYYSKFTKM